MIYGYCRATTEKQIEQGFLDEQEELIRERYFESSITREKSLDVGKKEEFDRLMDVLQDGDVLVVTTLDRIARSITEALEIIHSLKEKNINLHILNIGLLDDSVLGNILLDTLKSMELFEKSILVERIQSGKKKAKKQEGFREGRPKKYSDEQIREALKLLEEYSYKKVESMTGISKSTLIRAKKEMNDK